MHTVHTTDDMMSRLHEVTDYISHYVQQPPQNMPQQLRNLEWVDDHNAFWIHGGPVVHSLLELKHAVDTMTEEQFAYHVTDEKNDFELWVNHVLHDEDCADDMSRSKTRKGTGRILFKHLKKYEVPPQMN